MLWNRREKKDREQTERHWRAMRIIINLSILYSDKITCPGE